MASNLSDLPARIERRASQLMQVWKLTEQGARAQAERECRQFSEIGAEVMLAPAKVAARPVPVQPVAPQALRPRRAL